MTGRILHMFFLPSGKIWLKVKGTWRIFGDIEFGTWGTKTGGETGLKKNDKQIEDF